MNQQLILGFVMLFSWCAGSFFYSGVNAIVERYTNMYNHYRTMIYFGVAFLFLFGIIYLSSKQKTDNNNDNNVSNLSRLIGQKKSNSD